MARLSTNADLRAYATAHNVLLRDIAEELGMAPSTFSVQYMRVEQTAEVKRQLKTVIKKIAEARREMEA